MDKFEKKTLKVSRGFTYTYYITPSTPESTNYAPLLFHHGWPDSHNLWSKLVPFLHSLPNRLILPDLLGYAGTSKPTDVSALAFDKMAQDMCEILDAESLPTVISIGHDHGSIPAQRLYNFHPHRVAAVVLFNVAYNPPNKAAPPFDVAAFNAFAAQTFGYPLYEYWNFFALDPEAPRLMLENVERVWQACHADDKMKDMFCTPGAWKEYLTKTEVERFKLRAYGYDEDLKREWIETMREGGFVTPLNWYKAVTENVQREADKGVKDEDVVVRVPLLFIGGTQDVVCRHEFINAPKEAGLLPDLTVVVENAGHWIMLEMPDKCADHIKSFLKEKKL